MLKVLIEDLIRFWPVLLPDEFSFRLAGYSRRVVGMAGKSQTIPNLQLQWTHLYPKIQLCIERFKVHGRAMIRQRVVTSVFRRSVVSHDVGKESPRDWASWCFLADLYVSDN
jgi:hypothetical protein